MGTCSLLGRKDPLRFSERIWVRYLMNWSYKHWKAYAKESFMSCSFSLEPVGNTHLVSWLEEINKMSKVNRSDLWFELLSSIVSKSKKNSIRDMSLKSNLTKTCFQNWIYSTQFKKRKLSQNKNYAFPKSSADWNELVTVVEFLENKTVKVHPSETRKFH